MAVVAIAIVEDFFSKPARGFMRETVTGGWRLRKPKAVRSTRRGGSGNLAHLSAIKKLGQARWLLAMLVGLAWALAYPEPRFSRCSPGWCRAVCWPWCPAGEGWRLFGLAFFGGTGLSIGLAAVSIEHPAHGRYDRRLAGIERVRGAVLGGLGLALWRLVSVRFGESKLAVDQAILLWSICRCDLGGD